MDVKYLKRVFLGVLTALVSVALAAYLIYHIVLYFNNNIVTTTAISVTERQYYDCEGYLFRDETVLTSRVTGTVSPVYDDGSKVSVGSTVVNVYASAKDAERIAQIAELEDQIAILEDSSSGRDYADVGQVNKKISSMVAQARANIAGGDVTGALQLRDSLLVQLNRAQIITATIENFDTQIVSLNNQIATLRSQLGSVSVAVQAPESGYFYAGADGCESAFSVTALETLSAASFSELVRTVPGAVPPDGTVGKLVKGYRWYMVVSVSQEESEKFSAGDFYDMIFEDNADTRLTLSLEKIVFDVGEPQALLVFCCTNTPSGFNFSRSQKLRVVEREYTGYQVPRSAVRMVDGQQGVYILSGATVSFRKINVLYESEGYLIVAERDVDAEDKAEYLDLNDSVIIQGKELYDGKIIVG